LVPRLYTVAPDPQVPDHSFMARPNDKHRVRDHYDRVSPYYRALWGEHSHHGYWIRGDESKETAQLQLVEHLREAAGIRPRQRVLDVGCGFGGSSIYLARKYGAETTGITISPLQVEMAGAAAVEAGVRASFLLMDAEAMTFDKLFNVVFHRIHFSLSGYPALFRRCRKPAKTRGDCGHHGLVQTENAFSERTQEAPARGTAYHGRLPTLHGRCRSPKSFAAKC
jgi:cyclopropane fatty-acyl-phospholipid synthase-like methyltransferase